MKAFRRIRIRGAGRLILRAATTLLADNNQIQSQVGLSEARLQSSRIYVIETFRKLYEAAEQGLRLPADAHRQPLRDLATRSSRRAK